MDDLIQKFQNSNLEEFTDPLTELLSIKDEIEIALISVRSNEELLSLSQKVERFNVFIKTRINFDPDIYNDNLILYYICLRCNEYFNLSFHGSVRNRLLKSMNMYTCLLFCAYGN